MSDIEIETPRFVTEPVTDALQHELAKTLAPHQSTKLNVLSLCSGGLKSCFQAVVLSEIESITGKPVRELFDYISGVSAGSLCAAYLASPKKHTATDLVDFYKAKLTPVFRTSFWTKLKTCNGLLGSVYQNKLALAAEEQFGELKLSDSLTNVLILSYSLTTDRAKMFKSWDPLEDGKMSSVCLASSAIPGYFNGVEIDGETYFDGGLVSGNASTAVLSQIMRSRPDVPTENITMLTLGVGNLKEKLSADSSLFKWIWSANHSPLISTLLKDDIANETARTIVGDINYHYYNPEISVSEYNATTDTTQIDKLIDLARQWTQSHRVEIEDLCKQLVRNLQARNLKN